MAFTQTWTKLGTTPTVIAADSQIEFCGSTFDSPIAVGEAQGATFVRNVGNTDESAGKGPYNIKYVASGTCDIGGGTVALTHSSVTYNKATLSILLNGAGSITLSNVKLYAYKTGAAVTVAPEDCNVYAFQLDVDGAAGNDAAWTNCDGSAAALVLDEATFLAAATDHTAYIGLSIVPLAVGTHDTETSIGFEVTYQ